MVVVPNPNGCTSRTCQALQSHSSRPCGTSSSPVSTVRLWCSHNSCSSQFYLSGHRILLMFSVLLQSNNLIFVQLSLPTLSSDVTSSMTFAWMSYIEWLSLPYCECKCPPAGSCIQWISWSLSGMLWGLWECGLAIKSGSQEVGIDDG